jgi:hypothetical protein
MRPLALSNFRHRLFISIIVASTLLRIASVFEPLLRDLNRLYATEMSIPGSNSPGRTVQRPSRQLMNSSSKFAILACCARPFVNTHPFERSTLRFTSTIQSRFLTLSPLPSCGSVLRFLLSIFPAARRGRADIPGGPFQPPNT